MIPVIIIHQGYSSYLNYTITKASELNFVYYIGDVNPNINVSNYEFININTVSEGTNQFRSVYEHLNTTPYEYELFCYNRWFILKNFMLQRKLDVVFYIDSDVLIFVDVNKEWEKYNQYEMTLLHRTAAISSFITMNGIENFCRLINKIYSNKNDYPFMKIKSHFEVRQRCGLPGGVCDMTLLDYFHYSGSDGGGPGRIGEMMQIIGESTYDHNINDKDQDFRFENGIKSIEIKNKKPYVFNEKLNKFILFNSIHFQGGAKHLIPLIYGKCN